MKAFGLIRGGTRAPHNGRAAPRPIGMCESRFTLYLRLVTRHPAGPFTVGHYVADPAARPDHVFRHSSRFLTFSHEDAETAHATVTELTEAEVGAWEPSACGVETEHMVVLTDGHGNVILRDSCTAEEAERVMAAVARAGTTDAGQTE